MSIERNNPNQVAIMYHMFANAHPSSSEALSLSSRGRDDHESGSQNELQTAGRQGSTGVWQ
jgi:hypothetical protein